MIRNGVKTVVIYLEGWQKRMVKDFLGVDCDTYEFSLPEGAGAFHPLYAAPTHEECKRMYFTDWQMR